MITTYTSKINLKESDSKGNIFVLFSKVTHADDEEPTVGNHRTTLYPGQDIDAQMYAVNTHLNEMGFASVPQDEIDDLKAYATTVWTPEILAAYEAEQLRLNPPDKVVSDRIEQAPIDLFGGPTLKDLYDGD